MVAALSTAPTTSNPTHIHASHGLMMRQQSLRDSMRDIKGFNPGNDIHRFITDLNQAYTINVKPELADYPEMEGEFLKIAKRLLDRGIFQQMLDSQHDTDTFEQLKTYLITTHGNQMSNFQHLSRAWDLRRQDNERLTDFAGRLESTIREAAVHVKSRFKRDNGTEMTVDTAFSLVGAMLMSENIKAWTPNIYPHLVKTMDNHYTAGGIASEAQRYLDRGVKTDDTACHDITAYYNNPQRPKQSNDWPGQRAAKTSTQHAQKRYNTASNGRHPPNQKHRDMTQGPQICRNFIRGLKCFHGHNCPYQHPPPAQAHVASTVEASHPNDAQTNDTDFQYGPDEM